jgi:hypothetical protein
VLFHSPNDPPPAQLAIAQIHGQFTRTEFLRLSACDQILSPVRNSP